jgi:peroxiredoxin
VLAVRDHIDRLADSTGAVADIAVVTFTTHEFALRYRDHHGLPFPLLVDPDRAAYQAYGLERGSVGRVWGWRALKRYGEIIRSSGVANLRAPREDTLQLGGDFVVDAAGRLAWGFWGDGPDDRPSVDDLAVTVSRLS